jgi:hypothetical protein
MPSRYPGATAPDHYGDRVLSIAQWCDLNGFSLATGRRLLASGQGPRVIDLSARRKGIRLSDNRAWQDLRVRESA